MMTFTGLIHGQSENSKTTNFEILINSHSTEAKHDPRSNRHLSMTHFIVMLARLLNVSSTLVTSGHLNSEFHTYFHNLKQLREVLLRPWSRSIKEVL